MILNLIKRYKNRDELYSEEKVLDVAITKFLISLM